MSTAEQVSAIFGDNGQCWATPAGRTLDDVAQNADARIERHDGAVRYRFPDGSALIACEGGWDLGIPGASCWCWVGAGHQEGCPEAESDRQVVRRPGDAVPELVAQGERGHQRIHPRLEAVHGCEPDGHASGESDSSLSDHPHAGAAALAPSGVPAHCTGCAPGIATLAPLSGAALSCHVVTRW